MKYLINLLICGMCAFLAKAQPDIPFDRSTPAEAGTLDSNFGINGKVITEGRSGSCKAVTLQTDGKIIVGGSSFRSTGGLFLIRYSTEGSIDSSFGENGEVFTDISNDYYAAEGIWSLALQSDGKIVAAGRIGGGNVNIVLVRYLPEGSIDSSFGANGIVITDIRYYDYLNDMALQPDDKIVVTGITKSNENDIETSFTLRYNPEGSLDESFGEQGKVITVYAEPTEINAIAVQPDGKIVIGGNNILAPSSKVLLVRYLSDGSLDRSFGENGIATAGFQNIADYPILEDIALQQDGKIVTGGSSGVLNSFKRNMTLFRFESNGAVDNSFGNKGIVITDFDESNSDVSSEAKAVLIQPDGKIVATGNYEDYPSFTYIFALARYTSIGSLDSAFGNNGLQTTAFMGGTAAAEDAALQSNGKIVLVGNVYTAATSSLQIALARYIGDRTGTRPIYVRVKRLLGNRLLLTGELPARSGTANNTVERGSDGSQFNEVASLNNATIANSSNSTANNMQPFRYEDAAPLNGINYYRIKQTDNKGQVTYSNIVSEVVNETTAIKLYPNPVKDMLQVQGLNATVLSTISIYNWQGILMQKSTVQTSSHSLNVSRLIPGTYLLQVTDANGTKTARFVKK